jgi:hypothetical protein
MKHKSSLEPGNLCMKEHCDIKIHIYTNNTTGVNGFNSWGSNCKICCDWQSFNTSSLQGERYRLNCLYFHLQIDFLLLDLSTVWISLLFISGRVTVHDVSAFTKDSINTRLESLTPIDFESRRVGPYSTDMWFIDFFAPVNYQLYKTLLTYYWNFSVNGCLISWLVAKNLYSETSLNWTSLGPTHVFWIDRYSVCRGDHYPVSCLIW